MLEIRIEQISNGYVVTYDLQGHEDVRKICQNEAEVEKQIHIWLNQSCTDSICDE